MHDRPLPARGQPRPAAGRSLRGRLQPGKRRGRHGRRRPHRRSRRPRARCPRQLRLPPDDARVAEPARVARLRRRGPRGGRDRDRRARASSCRAPPASSAPRHQYIGDALVPDRHGRSLGHAAVSALETLPPPGSTLEFRGVVESGAALGMWEPMPYAPPASAAATTVHVDLPLRRMPTIEELEEQWAGINPVSLEERLRRARRVRAYYATRDPYPFTVWLLAARRLRLRRRAGEPYSWLQLELRRRHPELAVSSSASRTPRCRRTCRATTATTTTSTRPGRPRTRAAVSRAWSRPRTRRSRGCDRPRRLDPGGDRRAAAARAASSRRDDDRGTRICDRAGRDGVGVDGKGVLPHAQCPCRGDGRPARRAVRRRPRRRRDPRALGRLRPRQRDGRTHGARAAGARARRRGAVGPGGAARGRAAPPAPRRRVGARPGDPRRGLPGRGCVARAACPGRARLRAARATGCSRWRGAATQPSCGGGSSWSRPSCRRPRG